MLVYIVFAILVIGNAFMMFTGRFMFLAADGQIEPLGLFAFFGSYEVWRCMMRRAFTMYINKTVNRNVADRFNMLKARTSKFLIQEERKITGADIESCCNSYISMAVGTSQFVISMLMFVCTQTLQHIAIITTAMAVSAHFVYMFHRSVKNKHKYVEVTNALQITSGNIVENPEFTLRRAFTIVVVNRYAERVASAVFMLMIITIALYIKDVTVIFVGDSIYMCLSAVVEEYTGADSQSKRALIRDLMHAMENEPGKFAEVVRHDLPIVVRKFSIGTTILSDKYFAALGWRRRLEPVDFTLGRVNHLIAPNGTGKTTLFETLMNNGATHDFVKIHSGFNVWNFFDFTIEQARAIIRVCAQSPADIDSLHADVVCKYSTYWPQLISSELAQRIRSCTDKISTLGLSGGEKQMLANCMAIESGAQVIVFDEPYASLDSGRKSALRAIIEELAKQTIVVLISHDAENADYRAVRLARADV